MKKYLLNFSVILGIFLLTLLVQYLQDKFLILSSLFTINYIVMCASVIGGILYWIVVIIKSILKKLGVQSISRYKVFVICDILTAIGMLVYGICNRDELEGVAVAVFGIPIVLALLIVGALFDDIFK